MRNGYMGRVLFVDLSSGGFHEEKVPDDMTREFIGGYGLGARILWEKLPRGADPLGKDNVIGFLTGPFTGTKSFTSGRLTVVAKSPLTGFWGDSNCGGHFAESLKGCGYDGVFFTGRSNRPVYLHLTQEGPVLKDASHLWGMDTRQTEKSIRQEMGETKLRMVSIGPAGEKKSLIASIMTEAGRAAGRSGLGAVMGSKNLKAFSAKGNLKTPMADPDKVHQLNETMREELKAGNEPGRSFMKYGTCGFVQGAVEVQDAPIQNWKGVSQQVFDVKSMAAKISDENVIRYQTRKYACSSCPIGCGGIVEVKGGKWPVIEGHKPEYETVVSFGALCLNDDIESIITYNNICNLYGMDTISAGATVAFAMECYERGMIDQQDTGGIDLSWGNADAIAEVLTAMGERKGFGAILADGSRKASERIGKDSDKFAMQTGGQELPMHDPRFAPGYGTVYAVDPAPGRHTHGGTQGVEFGRENPRFAHLNLPKVSPHDYHNKGELHRVYSSWQHIINAGGICWFGSFCVSFPVVDLLNAITGWDTDVDELLATGTRILLMRHAFNLREGFRPSAFQLPSRVAGKPPLSEGPLKGTTIDMKALKDGAYQAMECDPDTGFFIPGALARFGLEHVVGEEWIQG